jgi:hypothetical protein
MICMVMCEVKVYNTFLNYKSNGRISNDFELFDTLKCMVISMKYFMLLSKWENFLSATWVFFSILWCSQIDDHQQEELPKFGYRPYMIIKGFKNPFIFWLFAWSCRKNLTISFSISEEIMAYFTKFLCTSGFRDGQTQSARACIFFFLHLDGLKTPICIDIISKNSSNKVTQLY